jgi:tetrahydromethanopterin S-methyltransferase subunit A
MAEIRKIEPAPGYPPEEGCYLRGNDFSPVAVCVILKWSRAETRTASDLAGQPPLLWNKEETPPEIEALVRVAIENGAALSGTLQTENIGLEKVICNIVANPNIRYLVVCGPESPGHFVGETILALQKNGVDQNKRIIGTHAPTPYLFNIVPESIERFRKQLTVVDLVNEGAPDLVRDAVRACYQENPTPFRTYLLHDLGAFPEPPLNSKITWRVTHPEREPKNDEERSQTDKFKVLADRVKKSVEARRQKEIGQ